MRTTLITLTLAAPAASYALGLGDIHVESALHQPLVAQIELVGVVNDELGRVSAALASDELFQKYNLERAPFIYGTTLSVGRDAQGRPVLNMRSTEKFTEPVVTLLVDMHTPSGELVREYTLFLDPAGLGTNAGAAFNSTAGVAPSTDVASNAAAAPNVLLGSKAERDSRAAAESPATSASTDNAAAVAPSGSSKVLGTKYTVARRDTLARIVTATGARSRTERHRMMVAIYRANPAAFQNNFSRMHTGVTLTFPTAEQLAAISVDETNREYDAQMAEWRASLRHDASTPNRAPTGAGDAAASPAITGSAAANAAAAAIAANNAREAGAPGPVREAWPTEHAPLNQRIASLEQSLAQIQQALKRPLPVQTPVAATAAATSAIAGSLARAANRATAAAAPAAVAAAAPAIEDNATSEDDQDDSPAAKHRGYQLITIGAGAGLLFFAGAWFYFRRRNSYALQMTPRYPLPVAAATAEEVTEDESTDQVEFSTPPPSLPQSAVKVREPVEAQQPATPKDPKTPSSWFEDSFSTPISDLLNDPTVSLGIDATEKLAFEMIDPTAKLPKQTPEPTVDTEVMVAPELEFAGDTVEQKFSFFNPEATINTEHVVMGSALTEPKAFVERRRNPADVLRQAIEREPDRSDLRLKLVELYYTAAAENRRAFLEATRQLAKRETLASPEDWSRIADMGRLIAPDDKLFSSDLDDQRVA